MKKSRIVENIERSARYKMLAGLLSKKPATVKAFFARKGWDIKDDGKVAEYLRKPANRALLYPLLATTYE